MISSAYYEIWCTVTLTVTHKIENVHPSPLWVVPSRLCSLISTAQLRGTYFVLMRRMCIVNEHIQVGHNVRDVTHPNILHHTPGLGLTNAQSKLMFIFSAEFLWMKGFKFLQISRSKNTHLAQVSTGRSQKQPLLWGQHRSMALRSVLGWQFWRVARVSKSRQSYRSLSAESTDILLQIISKL